MKIAIQGGLESFHHVAAREYFGDDNFQTVECRRFEDVAESLNRGQSEFALMAIENTLAGSIIPNFILIMNHRFSIVGELQMKIDQHLMALPGQKLDKIKTVFSHPVAMVQCRRFLSTLQSTEIIESYDTADSAKDIRRNDLQGFAAIAGESAAELYGLEILNRAITDSEYNYTRFLVLSTSATADPADCNKATITFRTDHKPGALSKVLTLLHKHGVNLSLIQSIPLADAGGNYCFYADLAFENRQMFDTVIIELKKVTLGLEVIGKYRSGGREIAVNEKDLICKEPRTT